MGGYGQALQAIGAELEAYGQIRAGQMTQLIHQYNNKGLREQLSYQQDALRVQGDLAERNAVITDQEATFAVGVAAYNETRFRRQGQRHLGGTRAAAGAAGVEVGSGSALVVLAESAREVEMDALTIRYQGQLTARAQADRAKMLRYEKELRGIESLQAQRQTERQININTAAGREALTGAWIGAAASLAKTYGSMLSGGGGMGGGGGG